MFFWNALAFSMIQCMLTIWSLVPLPFWNPALTSGSSQFMYCWSLAWRILSIILLACEMSATEQYFEHSLALPFFGIVIKTDIFQSCSHYWVFQISWYIECSTLTASSLRVWNSSAEILLPPLALFVVILSYWKLQKSHWIFPFLYFLPSSSFCQLACQVLWGWG